MCTCSIALCPCPCKVVAHACPALMGGNPATNYCPGLQELVNASPCAVHQGCVCPCRVAPSTNPLSLAGPGTARVSQAVNDAGNYVHAVAASAWDALVKDFKKLPSLTTILLVLFVMLAVLVFVYGFARSR